MKFVYTGFQVRLLKVMSVTVVFITKTSPKLTITKKLTWIWRLMKIILTWMLRRRRGGV